MRINHLLISLASISLCFLTGCSFSNSSKMASNINATPANNAEVEQKLVEIASSVERSLGLLAMSQENSNPPLLNTAPLTTPEGGMGGTADIDWTGPIEPLIHKIAGMTDYKVKTLGNPPPIPIIISITQNKSVIADILKNASLQAGKKASIMVFPASKIIEIRYQTG